MIPTSLVNAWQNNWRGIVSPPHSFFYSPKSLFCGMLKRLFIFNPLLSKPNVYCAKGQLVPEKDGRNALVLHLFSFLWVFNNWWTIKALGNNSILLVIVKLFNWTFSPFSSFISKEPVVAFAHLISPLSAFFLSFLET